MEPWQLQNIRNAKNSFRIGYEAMRGHKPIHSQFPCTIIDYKELVFFGAPNSLTNCLCLQDKKSMSRLVEKIDKANGFVFVDLAKKSLYPEFEYVNKPENLAEIWESYENEELESDVKEHDGS